MMGFLVAATMAMPFSFGEVKVSCAEPGDWKVACVREELEKGVVTCPKCGSLITFKNE